MVGRTASLSFFFWAFFSSGSWQVATWTRACARVWDARSLFTFTLIRWFFSLADAFFFFYGLFGLIFPLRRANYEGVDSWDSFFLLSIIAGS